jgi:hypothetical protein
MVSFETTAVCRAQRGQEARVIRRAVLLRTVNLRAELNRVLMSEGSKVGVDPNSRGPGNERGRCFRETSRELSQNCGKAARTPGAFAW